MVSLTSLAAALMLCVTSASAEFIRTVIDRSPLEYQYASTVGAPNVTDIIKFNTTGIKSYWAANFLTATDGNEYCIVSTTTNAGSEKQLSSISFTDITNGRTFGGSWAYDGQVSTTRLFGTTPILETGARSEDQLSELYVTSSKPEAIFNLTLVPKGPNVYQGASGAYIWGTGYAYTIDYPETWTTGTLVNFANETVDIIPEKSMSWFDMQWGPSFAAGGWHAFVIILDNGIKLQVTVTNPTDKYKFNSMATIGYPDGHNELHAVVGGVHPSNPWVSDVTNITYYHNYHISVPGRGVSLDVNCPLEDGETTIHEDPTAANTIADTFAWFSGFYDGVAVKGWGIAQLRSAADCGLFPC